MQTSVQLVATAQIMVLAIRMLIWTLELGGTIRLLDFTTCHKPLHHWMPLPKLLHNPFHPIKGTYTFLD
jgi:hypothetical protein